MSTNKKNERLGKEQLNNQGYLMKIIEYIDSMNIIIEFQDEYKTKTHTNYRDFKNGKVKNPNYKKYRMEEIKLNNQGCPMKIVEYNNYYDIIVEFQDKYKAKIHTSYKNFLKGNVRNPYNPIVYGVGCAGIYNTKTKEGVGKEYNIWHGILRRCYSDAKSEKNKKNYYDITVCEEWLCFENFYEWLHNQENFDKWLNGERWAVDKDILVKGNKIYSPETCCLVPQNVNNLFVKRNESRGDLPIGVYKNKDKYQSCCKNPFNGKTEHLGAYYDINSAFQAYKKTKESFIKQVAQEEYDKDNITKRCYESMMKYEVEITD